MSVLVLAMLGFALPKPPLTAQETEKPATATWAHIELKGSYAEGPQMMSLFGDVTESLAEAIGRLDKAAKDDSVTGVVLKIDGPSIGRGKLNEFRQAIGRVRAKGKKVVAYLDSAGSGDYLVAAGCDEVVMPESGVLMLLGVRSEVSFYKNLFDLIGLKAEMLRVGEYKSAAEPYSRTEMSKEFREELEQVLGDFYDQMVEQVATGRGLTAEKVKDAIDNGPHTAAAAKELGLITRVAYEDELTGILKGDKVDTTIKLTKRYGKKKLDNDFSGPLGMIKIMNMMMGLEPQARSSKNPKIAVIHASGMIMPGASASDFLGDSTLGSDTLVKAIEKASSDATVKAIVLRIDSPGGSALASDLIWRAIEKVEKPIVASMGDVAGSGGYYIAMGADTIFAEPGTITGSIGVVGGKIALEGLYNKVGITTSVVARGKNSGILSMTSGFTESERAAMTKLLLDIYKQFTEKAAKGRKMEYAKLEKLARGRIYSGATALKLGLIDKLGTLEDAVEHAKELA
ncbi:MAG: signal peptide peptidase SppA, partial [Planctomycetaceae bacterium]|nr:signal peptide peptidase SppA [Planctomycetaceae bacterium]